MANDFGKYKNSIYISKNGLGYFVQLNDNDSSSYAMVPSPNYKEAKGINFTEAIQALLNISSPLTNVEIGLMK